MDVCFLSHSWALNSASYRLNAVQPMHELPMLVSHITLNVKKRG